MIRHRTLEIMHNAIEQGVRLGCERAMKHSDILKVTSGSELHDIIGMYLETEVINALAEVFEIDNGKENNGSDA